MKSNRKIRASAEMTTPTQSSESRRDGFFVPHDIETPIRGSAGGPLAGLTAAVKDMYDIAGTRTGAGNPTWFATHEPARRNAVAVEKILAAGAIITGKAICEELFFSVTGINLHYGTPANVRAPGRMPGGSSSGSAAATAAGVCDFALGSDTGGSVRIPASFCGVYGIRPTHDRVDLAGAVAMAPSFDVAGWFAATPGVFRRVGEVLLGGERVDAPISTLIIASDAFAEADAGVVNVGQEFLGRAAAVLPPLRDVQVSHDRFDSWREAFRVVQGYEAWQSFGAFVTAAKPKLGPGIKERIAYAATITAAQADAARSSAAAARARICGLVPPGTVMALPTSPCIAPPVDMPAEAQEAFRVRVQRLTCMSVLSGLPQVTIPAGVVDGCPAGLSFVGWAGGDEALLDLACELARFCGVVRP
jgi:amidase